MSLRELARQVTRLGALALPIVAIGAALSGLAWAHASDEALELLVRRAPGSLGPIAALVLLSAPIGAAIAGEIGALRQGEQLAWLRAAGHSPFAHVIAARVVATGLVASLAAWLAAAALVGAASLGVSREAVALSPFAALALGDLLPAAAFAAASGVLLAAIGCGIGLRSRAGIVATAARGAGACLVAGSVLSLLLLASARV